MRFVRVVANELGEFPDLWNTLNEPSVPPTAGYLAGVFPPEKKSFRQFCLVVNRLLHAHAESYVALHEIVRSAPGGGPLMVGTAHAYQHVDAWGTPGLAGLYENLMKHVVSYGSFGGWDEGISSGRIPLPFGIGEKVDGLKDSCDFCGVNYYTRMSVKFNPRNPQQNFLDLYEIPEGIEENQMGWQVFPPGMYHTLKAVWKRFGKPIYITENGVADPDDTMRPGYTLEHLAQIHRAIEDGVDVRGYFHWSFSDNFEWREGYVKKLGLIACDYSDPRLTRVPRQSAYMYSDIIKENAITEEIVAKYSPGVYDGVFGDRWRF